MGMTMMAEVATQEIANVDADSLFVRGLQAFTGAGADYDLVEAHKWFNIAAVRGNVDAMSRRRELAAMMTGAQVAAAQKAAREWLNHAAN